MGYYWFNKKVIGNMKDECEGKIIDEFVGLKLKMYSIKYIDGKESNTAKRVNIATKIGTYEIDKISLLCFDDKRFVLNDGINYTRLFS